MYVRDTVCYWQQEIDGLHLSIATRQFMQGSRISFGKLNTAHDWWRALKAVAVAAFFIWVNFVARQHAHRIGRRRHLKKARVAKQAQHAAAKAAGAAGLPVRSTPAPGAATAPGTVTTSIVRVDAEAEMASAAGLRRRDAVSGAGAGAAAGGGVHAMAEDVPVTGNSSHEHCS